MKQLLIATVLIIASSSVFSQEKYFKVTGVVVDEKSKQPMAGASVFCQNTTNGTTCNNEGRFFLRLGNGGYDMVVSYTGYETKVLHVSNGNKDNDSLVIELKEKDKALEEVVVAGSAEVADGWNKYGQFFLDNFIGTTPNAANCTIENKDVIKFYFYKKRNKLKVKSKEDIIIVNKALGYRIKYQLDSFVYDYTARVSIYTGYPLFSELGGTLEEQNTYRQNRLSAYTGSRLHFMRSWYDSTLSDEGFELELLDAPNSANGSKVEDPYNQTIYNVDSGDVEINFKGKMRIKYKNQTPDKKYLVQNHFPLSAREQISAIDIAEDGFVIEQNGYFYDQSDVTNSGYWAWKKLAELLPYDYNPE